MRSVKQNGCATTRRSQGGAGDIPDPGVTTARGRKPVGGNSAECAQQRGRHESKEAVVT